MSLHISSACLENIERHAERTFPEECCGILLGHLLDDGAREVTRALPTPNEGAPCRQSRYRISPEALLGAERQARAARLRVVGIYHSHPDGPARPSALDRDHAVTTWSYVVVSCAKGRSQAVRSWRVHAGDGDFEEEGMTSTTPPRSPTDAHTPIAGKRARGAREDLCCAVMAGYETSPSFRSPETMPDASPPASPQAVAPAEFSSILVHYAEIATKGRNRPMFVGCLARNIRRALSGLPVADVQASTGRLWITAQAGATLGQEACDRLRTVFGIASFSPARRVPLELEAIQRCALELVLGRRYESFRVTARRAFKDLPFPSQELNRDVGAYLCLHRPARVQMKNADLEVFIEEVPSGALLYVDKLPGLGGLPVGVSGTVAVLLSGGIDSPVAAFRMQRRGLKPVYVHMHSHPFHSTASQEKVRELAAHLARYQHEAVLYLVPFGELQRDIVTRAPPALRVVLYRRFMLRIAAALGEREDARALVTGEALGQVASQTLDNMVAIEQAAPMPVLRPLIAFDKQEIIDQAMALCTYETSILPDQDCCTLFMPRRPETRAQLADVLAAEAELDVEAMCHEATGRSERLEIRAPWWTPERPKRRRAPREPTDRRERAPRDDGT